MDAFISGKTKPNSNVRAVLRQQDMTTVLAETSSDSQGKFRLEGFITTYNLDDVQVEVETPNAKT